VLSTGERESEVAAKVQMWLDAGVRLVFVAFPVCREVVVHRAAQPLVVLALSDTVSGDDFVPGFSCPIRQVFGIASG
jgi:hypothetical protein